MHKVRSEKIDLKKYHKINPLTNYPNKINLFKVFTVSIQSVLSLGCSKSCINK